MKSQTRSAATVSMARKSGALLGENDTMISGYPSSKRKGSDTIDIFG